MPPKSFSQLASDDNYDESGTFEIESGQNDGFNTRTSSSTFGKYSYLTPMQKYSIIFFTVVLIGIVAMHGGGDGSDKNDKETNNYYDYDTNNPLSHPSDHVGSPLDNVLDEISNEESTPIHPSDVNPPKNNADLITGSWNPIPSGKDPADWNPTIIDDRDTILSNLDTNRDAMEFKHDMTEEVIYMQKTIIQGKSNDTEFGELTELETYMDFDSLFAIHNNERTGDKEVSYMVTRFLIDSEEIEDGEKYGTTYDSTKETGNTPVEDYYYFSFDQVVGRKSTITLSKYGQISYESDEEKYLENLEEEAPGLSALSQYDKTSRIAQYLPFGSKKPGDVWDISIKSDGFDYDGSVQLLGYTTYENVDCAVFDSTAVLSLDKIQSMDDVYVDDAIEEMIESLSIKNGSIESIVLWDVENHFPRYQSSILSMTMEMENPMLILETAVVYMSL